MFVGFIAVVAILLVIVGLMSSGGATPGGSALMNNTKATKMLQEISGIVQSVNSYKSVSPSGSYYDSPTEYITMTSAKNYGIFSDEDLYTVLGTETFVSNWIIPPVAGDKLLKSLAIPGVYYKIDLYGVGTFALSVVVDTANPLVTSDLKIAMESAYKKLPNNFLVNTTLTDGATTLNFK